MITWYNLVTLKIDNLTLDMIENFSPEMEKRRMELFNISKNSPEKFVKELREEYATLEFTKAADFFRDQVMADWKIDESEKDEVTRALRLLARVNKLKAGIDSY